MTNSTLRPGPFDRWHVGPWSMPAADPGAPGTTGAVLTHDELLLDVVSLARTHGWREPESADATALARVEAILEATPVGGGTVTDPQLAAVLQRAADDAFRWLAEQAPAGYRLDLDNGLRLAPITDLTAAVVPVEAVVSAARDRGIDIPAGVAQLAVAHVEHTPEGWCVHFTCRCAWPDRCRRGERRWLWFSEPGRPWRASSTKRRTSISLRRFPDGPAW